MVTLRSSPRGALETFIAAKGGAMMAIRVPIAALFTFFFLLAMVMHSEDLRALAELSFDSLYLTSSKLDPFMHVINTTTLQTMLAPDDCDLSSGEWLYDNVSFPMYKEKECTFMSKQMTCTENGRTDEMYQHWRWQPKGCSLPLFDARVFMERMRGKRLLFVGDSLNRNQWDSMVCLVQSVCSRGRKRVTKKGSFIIFHAKEYGATIEFYWAPFLVESNSDNPQIHSIEHRIIKAREIERHAKHWKGVDYLIFNTYIWWMSTANTKVRRPGSKDWSEHEEIVRIDAYEMVLKTWSDWVNANIDPAKTMVFFMSISPAHFSPDDWGNPNGIKCAKETMPVLNFTAPLSIGSDTEMFNLVVKVTQSMTRVPVTLVNITRLSEYRKDAHASVYTVRQGKLLTPKQRADPQTYADCIHWCLPGVPDTWNLILYNKILSRSLKS